MIRPRGLLPSCTLGSLAEVAGWAAHDALAACSAIASSRGRQLRPPSAIKLRHGSSLISDEAHANYGPNSGLVESRGSLASRVFDTQ
jgi:hypothetical protein